VAGRGVLAYGFIGLLLLVVGVPFYWMVNTSLKTSAQLQSLAPYYYPSPGTLGNYRALLGTTNFPIWIRNSALVAVGATLVTVLESSLAGYRDRKSTRLNSSHLVISYAVFCLKKKKTKRQHD